jgi:hypothetical protein
MTRETLQDFREERLKIPLVGHTCSPDLGSEPGLMWNCAWHLSAQHDVWVVTRSMYRFAVGSVMRRHREQAGSTREATRPAASRGIIHTIPLALHTCCGSGRL